MRRVTYGMCCTSPPTSMTSALVSTLRSRPVASWSRSCCMHRDAPIRPVEYGRHCRVRSVVPAGPVSSLSRAAAADASAGASHRRADAEGLVRTGALAHRPGVDRRGAVSRRPGNRDRPRAAGDVTTSSGLAGRRRRRRDSPRYHGLLPAPVDLGRAPGDDIGSGARI